MIHWFFECGMASCWFLSPAECLQKEFLDKYESFVQMVTRIYGNEPIMSVADMKDVLANF